MQHFLLPPRLILASSSYWMLINGSINWCFTRTEWNGCLALTYLPSLKIYQNIQSCVFRAKHRMSNLVSCLDRCFCTDINPSKFHLHYAKSYSSEPGVGCFTYLWNWGLCLQVPQISLLGISGFHFRVPCEWIPGWANLTEWFCVLHGNHPFGSQMCALTTRIVRRHVEHRIAPKC